MSESFDRPLSISIERADGIVLMSLGGELDAATAGDLQAHLSQLAADRSVRLIIDLAQLEFIDSSGLNALALGSRVLAANGGSLVVAGAAAHIQRVFEIVHLASEVHTEATVGDARRALARLARDTDTRR